MAKASTNRQTKTSKNQNTTKELRSTYLVPFLATFAGVAFGVLVSLGFMAPILKAQVASATQNLGSQVVRMLPASSLTSCSGAAGNGNGSSSGVKTASMPHMGGKGGGQGGGDSNTWVHKFITGVYATTTGSIRDTGPNSNNSIKTTNTNTTTVTNTNNVNVSNSNDQDASSGSSNVSGNTNGGSAHSGSAYNDNESSTDINIEN